MSGLFFFIVEKGDAYCACDAAEGALCVCAEDGVAGETGEDGTSCASDAPLSTAGDACGATEVPVLLCPPSEEAGVSFTAAEAAAGSAAPLCAEDGRTAEASELSCEAVLFVCGACTDSAPETSRPDDAAEGTLCVCTEDGVAGETGEDGTSCASDAPLSPEGDACCVSDAPLSTDGDACGAAEASGEDGVCAFGAAEDASCGAAEVPVLLCPPSEEAGVSFTAAEAAGASCASTACARVSSSAAMRRQMSAAARMASTEQS